MFLKDFLFPKFCLGCGFLGAYICHNCRKNLYYMEKDMCIYCSHNSLYGLTHPACKRRYGIDGFLSIFHYNNLLKSIIKSIKYRYALDVWREFCLIIEPESILKVASLKKIVKGPIFLEPIPLHRSKLRHRGFNQARIIAEYFSHRLSLPMTSCLVRTKDTEPQAQLRKNSERFRNMQGAFDVEGTKVVTGQYIILIDDVVTTGSTVKEAARALKLGGAKGVFTLSVAHG
ncbi:hypothetical protein A2866_03830 [Candidatus Roizmanbacteria bacterium RIFCSPHIGHO2_01_FULL_39_8]|uniref:Phosphoribosyltransferase domain-containing protein n=3 Tax=Candidatus Roizmaniibacteriota TaxID=1752723 RepID=A0A1F7GRA7_9BACT|nr:MAG: hypothetical protein A2866_03830 [Candidatus Roizmanbacteria bacterium RIFCSPHIGHO2_01_FULL_39_8]OGK25435.1 MAG: hypothetical protein A3C28_06560 [Candidatus Roizmanbacteria bacterium RIFCSPHIGHO2_02_FULL_39_9]OGK35670.1 MAG: hypothetical protein A3F60_01165 [Candidatus Roizmanbacteria bacterium RIFCSPHIGHO2_12_FULL_39_8]